MRSGASSTLRTLTTLISSKHLATLNGTGTLGFPADYDLGGYLPLSLPTVFGGPHPPISAYPARIVAGAPEVAREHAGLALSNAIAQADDRGEAMKKVLTELLNRALVGTTLESTVLAEVLEETYEQLGNRMFLGRARGDPERLGRVPNQFRRFVVCAVEEFLMGEWEATGSGEPILLKRLINISSLYGYLHSRGMIYAHEFLETLTHILEDYTAESLDLLMIAVIYLMSRGTMTKARRAIPLELWVLVQGQLNGLEGKARTTLSHHDESAEEETVELLCGTSPTKTQIGHEPGDGRVHFFDTLNTLKQSPVKVPNDTPNTPLAATTMISHPTFNETYRTATAALGAFIDEFILADTHTSLFNFNYPCGYVEFCADPPPKYAKVNQDGTAVHNKKWYYLNRLCSKITQWANGRGIQSEVRWGIILEMEYDEREFEEDEDGLGRNGYEIGKEGQEEGDEDAHAAGTEGEGEVEKESHCVTSPGFTPLGFEPITWTFPATTEPTDTCNSTPLWRRRGMKKPRFLEWKPRLVESTFPYPLAYQPSKPNPVVNNKEQSSHPPTKTPTGAKAVTDAPGPFLLRLSDLTSSSPTKVGSHHLLPPIDPRIATPDPRFKKAMKDSDLVWRLGPSGTYKASLVARPEKGGGFRPQEWILRQDDLISPFCRK